jgi:hypothetical protein
VLRARHAAGEIGFPLDDSWIHVRFAQNLAAGKGFSFNPGVPTSTTTSVLWTLLLAAVYRVTHEYLFTSFALNWALCVLLCATVYHLALVFTPSAAVALRRAAAVAFTAPCRGWALSGMEPPYALLATLHCSPAPAPRSARAPCSHRHHGTRRLARPELLSSSPAMPRPAADSQLPSQTWGGRG